MLIEGKYVKDSNFTTVFTEDTMYTIARNTGDWDCIKIGDRMANGHILSKETFEAWKSECEEGNLNWKIKIFTLKGKREIKK